MAEIRCEGYKMSSKKRQDKKKVPASKLSCVKHNGQSRQRKAGKIKNETNLNDESPSQIQVQPQKPQQTLKNECSGKNKKRPEYKIRCWAHTRNSGERCNAMISRRENEPVPIPYCKRHMNNGDGALKVVKHPFAGKCLVARYDLPAKYRIAFWGKRGRCDVCSDEDRSISYYPPDKRTGRNKEKDGTRRVNYNGVLNPEGTGDLIQYAACPGPNERQNMRSTYQYWGVRNGTLGGLEFITLESIPKNTQLCHWYGSGWWSARGVKRKDVGTKLYPAPRRFEKNRS